MMRQEQDVPCLIADEKPWTHLEEIALHPGQGTVADGDDPVLLALALPDFHRASLSVDVVHAEMSSSMRRMPVRVQRLHDGPVPHAQRRVHVGQVDDDVGFLGGQDELGQALLQLGQFQFTGGVVEQVVAAGPAT